MRIGITVWGLILLTACQSTFEVECASEGYQENTPEFRECVADRRMEKSVRMKRKAAGEEM